MKDEAAIARQSTYVMFAAAALTLLLVLDLMNRGLVWRTLRELRSANTGSLPGEDRTVGETHRAEVTFLS
jgi:hypothetical protein